MRTISAITELRSAVAEARRAGRSVGFVPTMGYLHAGHMALCDQARTHAPNCLLIVSIYVNPTQFGPTEDLSKYPRDLAGDSDQCQSHGVDIIFTPTTETMYPGGLDQQQIRLSAGSLAAPLCGADRPVHFGGVLTVVSKLFNLVQPDFAVFGEKDFQQLRLIERMVEELHFPVRILRGPTVREADGLAMSSRNSYLSTRERAQAAGIAATLRRTAQAIAASPQAVATAMQAGHAQLAAHFGAPAIQYFEARRESDLELIDTHTAGQPARIFAAVRVGPARLIDNCPI